MFFGYGVFHIDDFIFVVCLFVMSSPPIKEVLLEEIELHSSLLEEGLSCLLHTIIFVRHPGSVRPVDFSCTQLAPLTFAKCGLPNADTRVKSAIGFLFVVPL